MIMVSKQKNDDVVAPEKLLHYNTAQTILQLESDNF
jgi:hypothetical protein